MPEEGFLRRWARVKATGDDAVAEAPRAPAPAPAPATAPAHAPAHASAPAPAPARWARAGEAWARAGDPLPVAPAESGDAGPAPEPSAAAGRISPTLDDVAQLTPDSDYSVFVGQGVDKSVQRQALKKLFADPHFNVMDRLDMYMDDYNIPSPVSAEMLASLDHARSALRRFVEDEPTQAAAAATAPGAEPPDPAAAQATTAAAPQSPAPSPAPDAVEHEAVPHNEAAHASAAHEDQLPGESPGVLPSGAPTHEVEHKRGLFHRPNQQLPQGQV
ncbi:DUF3306 domain-containing protein [Massilia niabensis]|uniref:DUF3306 domain-containing protein n=1 Tax=Massilia niabensis TaxID=544910 RepID=A0ABW0L522_9BURK